MELVLLWYKTWHRVGLVIQSLLLTTTQQPHYNCPLLLLNMPMLNSRTFQSSSGINTITRPTPKRSGGDYPSGQQVVVTNLVLIDWRLICYDLDPWYGLHRPPFNPGVQEPWNGRLPLGLGPLQPWRIGEASRTGAKRSPSIILVEDHQDGSYWSWGRREGYGRLYSVHETLFSNWDAIMEDVERGWKWSEFILVLSQAIHLPMSSW